ncbi:TIR domain-containing protein [Sandaracinobacteroides hominis]|uniref:TIR domain-containing protein n=1 Tax=Sandaracinobacteroides hominis TaxID=2780086 RepID=UPI0018F31C25|nr:TIR domain-containing protein [Sandaracinobacteroides hominis]
MADIFISYARSTEAEARQISAALRALGYSVWRDDELPAHRAFAEVIEERLRAARAVLVIWSPDALKSQWVRAEANFAREAGKLVQLRLVPLVPPIPFSEIQCADMAGWDGEADNVGWRKVLASIAELTGPVSPGQPGEETRRMPTEPLLAVLAFDNLSHDPEMAYFSDGISEEILHTVSRSKGMRVIGKSSSFQFRGTEKSARRIVDELGATHMLDGSVRRAGDRVRITAQLVDTDSQMTLWSERYDRSLTDIFELQDEIAAAIAAQLDAHFTPGPKMGAIDPAAYDLFLQARAIYAQDSTIQDRVHCVQLLEQTVALAPDFATAWGQLAMFRGFSLPKSSDADGALIRPVALSEAQRALALDPECGPAFTALALLTPAFQDHAERVRLAERGFSLTTNDSSVAHIHVGALMSVGRNGEACRIFDEIAANEPASPYSRAIRAFFHHSAGHLEKAHEMAEGAVRDFPDSPYARFMLDQLTRSRANLIVDVAESERASAQAHIEKRIQQAHPVLYLVHVGRTARLGDMDRAFELLFTAIDEGRPLAFDPAPDGRGFSRALASVGLFSPVGLRLRQDPRFAELCVRLGLHDYWTQSGAWPDCVAEVAEFYDFRAACEAAAVASAGREPYRPNRSH